MEQIFTLILTKLDQLDVVEKINKLDKLDHLDKIEILYRQNQDILECLDYVKDINKILWEVVLRKNDLIKKQTRRHGGHTSGTEL